MRPHAQISIEEDAEVADAGRRQNKVFTDPQRSKRQLMLSMCSRTPEQISLAGVELQTVRPHPRRDVIKTGRQTQLRIVCLEMRVKAMLFDESDQISRIEDEEDRPEY